MAPFAIPGRGKAIALLTAIGLGGALGGCANQLETTGSLYPADYRDRHPIVLANGPRSLDLFANSPTGLSPREMTDLRLYIQEYHRNGRGPIVAQVPVGAGEGAGGRAVLRDVRASLAAAGVPARHLTVTRYQPTDAAMAAPVRLSFKRLEARVAGKCGLWPDDLGTSDFGQSMSNQEYWNYGCALQANVASQVADPIDLVRGRPEGRPDTIRRTQNIVNIRQAKDPSTTYKQDGQNRINQSVGQ